MPESLSDLDPDLNILELFDTSCEYYSLDAYNEIPNEQSLFNRSLLNYNIRSFAKNSPSFEGFVDSMLVVPDIVVLSETWNSVDSVATCNLGGFRGSHTYRTSSRGGGVSVRVII